MKRLVITALALSANIASATIGNIASAPTEVWQGKGKLQSVDRQQVSEYTLEVRIEEVSDVQNKVKVEIRDLNGQLIKTDNCVTQKYPGHAWTKACDGGASRGYMVADELGLGIDYYEATDGKAYSTTIIFDSATEMRLFRTALLDGRATHFFAEALKRVSKQ